MKTPDFSGPVGGADENPQESQIREISLLSVSEYCSLSEIALEYGDDMYELINELEDMVVDEADTYVQPSDIESIQEKIEEERKEYLSELNYISEKITKEPTTQAENGERKNKILALEEMIDVICIAEKNIEILSEKEHVYSSELQAFFRDFRDQTRKAYLRLSSIDPYRNLPEIKQQVVDLKNSGTNDIGVPLN